MGSKTNCETSRREVQRSNNQNENIMSCVSIVPSHSGSAPGVSTELCTVFGSVKVPDKKNYGSYRKQMIWGY